MLREFIAANWSKRSSTTRAKVISILHSFFGWAETEDLIEDDPSRKIRRPPKRKPDRRRPSPTDLELARNATSVRERPAWLLMEGVGLRVASVIGCRWDHVDLRQGRIRVLVKGHHWHELPIAPDVLNELRACYDELAPDATDHVWVTTRELWENQYHRVTVSNDPDKPSSPKSLWRMAKRVSERAGIESLSPHQLRHGFATRLDRMGADLHTIQYLLGHSRPDTTKVYLDERRIEDAQTVLDGLFGAQVESVEQASKDVLQASPDETTEHAFGRDVSQTLEWRRRESNPRPRSFRTEHLQA